MLTHHISIWRGFRSDYAERPSQTTYCGPDGDPKDAGESGRFSPKIWGDRSAAAEDLGRHRPSDDACVGRSLESRARNVSGPDSTSRPDSTKSTKIGSFTSQLNEQSPRPPT